MKNSSFTFLKTALFLAIGAVSFSSCGDDDDSGGTPATNKTRTQLLIENSWRQTAYTQTDGTQVTDLFTGSLPCDADDLLKFNAANNTANNGTYEYNEGASKCDPADPQVFDTGTWAFAGTDQLIVTDANGGVLNGTILELSDNTLKVHEPGSDSTSFRTATYTAQ